MAKETGRKIAMFFAGLGAIVLALVNLVPNIYSSITDLFDSIIPYSLSNYFWVIYVIYGIAGGYVLLKAFK